MHLSERGADFIARHEGFVSRAYRDPVGVLTIGTGFTNRSQAFRAYWRQTRGHDLRPGDTITREECLKILPAVADEEYGAAVMANITPKQQHHYDGAVSVAFNLGPAATTWRWGRALRDGDVAGCAQLLRNGYNTAGGKVLKGLVTRRRHEAALIRHGDYGDGKANAFGADDDAAPADAAGRRDRKDDLVDYQARLKALGYDPGPIDGLWGSRSRAAVLKFQVNHPHLVADGVLGPATKAAIDRAAEASGAVRTSPLVAAGLASAVAAAALPAGDHASWVVIGGLVVVAALCAYAAWTYRDEIAHWWRG